MKTAIEELIEYIELYQPKNKVSDGIWSKAKSLLQKEREQIESAFNEGYREAEIDCNRVSTTDISEWGNANIYYETTFKK